MQDINGPYGLTYGGSVRPETIHALDELETAGYRIALVAERCGDGEIARLKQLTEELYRVLEGLGGS